jgi:hypothetical protein
MKPQKVDTDALVFGMNINNLMPEWNSIPEEFKKHKGNQWADIFNKWFFSGLKGKFILKDGIDLEMAMRHIKCIMGSWDIQHEVKEASVTYLMSLWFEKFQPS